jgi:DNA-binding transcriptional regulator YhcF (GntR family)
MTPAPAGKTIHVRHYVLNRIEHGDWPAGSALPGARDLATELGISFVKVQQALETLALDGVIEMRPRIGTFVRAGWRDCILRDNISVFNRRQLLPWVDGLSAILTSEMPGLRLTDAFPRSVVELKTLLHVQQHHDHYLDLAPLLAASGGPGRFDAPFAAVRVGKRLVGIPIIASPRFLVFNPDVLRRHDCPLPAAGWTWNDFLAIVRRLLTVLPAHRVLDWSGLPYYWLNLVRRAGGRLFDDQADDPIAVDRSETRMGLRLCRELAEILGRPQHDLSAFTDDFVAGEAALAIGTRQFTATLRLRGHDAWQAVPLPLIPGGRDTSSMAGDYLCIRDTCTDPELARRAGELMLSPAVQDHLGGLRYGVPVNRTSAVQSLDLNDPREVLILTEHAKMSSEPTQESADLTRLVLQGVTRILDGSDDLDRDVTELARAARLHLAIQRYVPRSLRPST